LTDRATALVAFDPCHGIDLRKIDQRMARQNDVQAEKIHQEADGGLAFAQREQLRTKIMKGAVRLAHVACGEIVRLDRLRADGQLPCLGQRYPLKKSHPLESFASKAQQALYGSADQLDDSVTQRRWQQSLSGRHTTACRALIQSGFELPRCNVACGSINPNRSLPTRTN
jgi:hypothetical protein